MTTATGRYLTPRALAQAAAAGFGERPQIPDHLNPASPDYPLSPVEFIRGACRDAGAEAWRLMVRDQQAGNHTKRGDFSDLFERLIFAAIEEAGGIDATLEAFR